MKINKNYTTWQEHRGMVLDTEAEYDIIDCEECRFIHITPIPSPEELKNIYEHEYYVDDKPLYIERFKEDLEWWELAYDDRYDSFESSLPQTARRLLDIGSGPGYFLKQGQKRGWEVMGVEPSLQAHKHSTEVLGLNVLRKEFNSEVANELGFFDVIHLSEVLEHIPDPQNLLRVSHKILEVGGLICIVVPNDYNPFQEALRAACGFKPWWVAPPHHINYFSFSSLSRIVEDVGFTVLQMESTFPIDMFLLMGQNYIGNDDVGRQSHGQRKAFELNLDKAGLNHLRRKLYESFSKLDIGREILLIAQK